MSSIFIIATPIGNLEDITLRAKRILGEVDIIAAEDTRHAKKLLSALQIPYKKMIALHDHNEKKTAQEICQKILDESISLALISDAGTPQISDPGFHLLQTAREKNISLIPIPGVSALTTLLSVFPIHGGDFLFVGFLPDQKSKLLDEIKSWQSRSQNILFFEAPKKFEKCLNYILESYPEAKISIGREMTKLHEEYLTLSITDALTWIKISNSQKGELSAILHLPPKNYGNAKEISDEEIILEIHQGKTNQEILKKFKDQTQSRNDLYQRILQLKKTNPT